MNRPILILVILLFFNQWGFPNDEIFPTNLWDRLTHFELQGNFLVLTSGSTEVYELEVASDGSVIFACSPNKYITRFEKQRLLPYLHKWSFLPSSEESRFFSFQLINHEKETTERPTGSYFEFGTPNILHFRYNQSTLIRLDRVDGRVPKADCSKHKCEMTIGVVPLSSGLFSYKREVRFSRRSRMRGKLDRTTKRLFPNCPSLVRLPFCGLSEKWAETFICNICKTNKENWLEKNPDFKEILFLGQYKSTIKVKKKKK